MFDDVVIEKAEYTEPKKAERADVDAALEFPHILIAVRNFDEFVAWEKSDSQDNIDLDVEIIVRGFNDDEKISALKNILINLAGQL